MFYLKHADTMRLRCVLILLITFFNSDCMYFIFLTVASVCMPFSWILEYLWYSKRSVDGQVLLYPTEDIDVDICSSCRVYMKGYSEF